MMNYEEGRMKDKTISYVIHDLSFIIRPRGGSKKCPSTGSSTSQEARWLKNGCRIF
jgi:hypothetical protein